jgi:TIR domain
MADVFISYASGDSGAADQLALELKARGLSVFFDKGGLVAGTDFRQEIAQALGSAKAVVVLLSANTKRSSWVQEELSSVIERTDGPTVIPVLLDQHAKENWVWPLISDRMAVDLSNRQEKIGEVASRLAELVTGRPQTRMARARSTRKLALLIAAIVLTLVTMAIFVLPLSDSVDPSDPLGVLSPWRSFIFGALGVVIGYFVSRWRK